MHVLISVVPPERKGGKGEGAIARGHSCGPHWAPRCWDTARFVLFLHYYHFSVAEVQKEGALRGQFHSIVEGERLARHYLSFGVLVVGRPRSRG